MSKISPYRGCLQNLFEHYELTAVDVSTEPRTRSGQSPVPDTFIATPILDATAAVLADPDLARPNPVSPLIVSENRFPAVHNKPQTGQEDAFINSLMQIPAW